MKILLIAGHGENDPGAIGYQNLHEADLTRELCKLIAPKLDNYVDLFVYPYTQDCYQQSKKGNVPNYSLYDYVIELHFNSFSQSSANGTEILVHKNEVATTVEENILNKMTSVMFTNKRGVIRRSDLLNMNTCNHVGVSYALIETCFISNESDMKNYLAKKDSVAQAIVDGIVEGFGINQENVSRETLYKVQVGAFAVRENAENMKLKLESQGYQPYIVKEVK